jgi:hypothetical protein
VEWLFEIEINKLKIMNGIIKDLIMLRDRLDEEKNRIGRQI